MANTLMDAPDVLKKIADYKVDEVAALKSQTSIEELRKHAKDTPPPLGFLNALKKKAGPAIIAEVKKASPSKGIIREDFDPLSITKSYETGGATCLSVLTDGPGFQGSIDIFNAVRATTSLPLLRKDFMIDPIQVAQSRVMGADCILVILAMIDDYLAKDLIIEATELGMDALIETHDQSELDRALALNAPLIGINNRDLRTFNTTLDTFAPLAQQVPDHVTLVAESGVFTKADIDRLTKEGATAFLIGESFMRKDDVAGAVRGLLD